jgi:hypothetical protein
MTDRWECRYSSCEMLNLEFASGYKVRCYLDHSPQNADFHSFDSILAGEIDGMVSSLFGAKVLNELKAAVRRRLGK